MIERDLLYALRTAREQLPQDTHPIYLARLDIIERLIVWVLKSDTAAKQWEGVLRREEHKIDVQQKAGR